MAGLSFAGVNPLGTPLSIGNMFTWCTLNIYRGKGGIRVYKDTAATIHCRRQGATTVFTTFCKWTWKTKGSVTKELPSGPWYIQALWLQGQYSQRLACLSALRAWLEGEEGKRRALIYNASNTLATAKSSGRTSSHVNRDTPKTGAQTIETLARESFLLFCNESHRRLAWPREGPDPC